VVSRKNSRRINHLRAEIAQLHRFDKRQVLDHIGIADHLRVGGHKTVHIGPNFERIGFERRGQHRSGIIGTAAPEVRHVVRLVIGGNETRYHDHLRHRREPFADQLFGRCEFDDMFPEIGPGLDKFTGVVQFGASEYPPHDHRRKTLPVTHDRIARLGGEILDQIDSLEDIGKFVQQRVHRCKYLRTARRIDHFVYRPAVTHDDLFELAFVLHIACGRHSGSQQQLIRNTSQRRHDDNHLLTAGFHHKLHLPQTFRRTYGRPSKLQYFHIFMIGLQICNFRKIPRNLLIFQGFRR